MLSPTDHAARLRGAAVGTASGAVAVAAHGLGGGSTDVGGSALALLIVACGLIGVVVASVRPRAGVLSTMGMLAVGQSVGHEALSMAPQQHQHGLSAGMVAAHLVAIPVGAFAIRAAEVGLRRAVTSVRRFIVALGPMPVAPGRVLPVAFDQRPVPARLLVSSGVGRRGPPRRVRLPLAPA
ncbi:hypothetical protein IU474_25265 [Nocardia otitidiscaviarum]|uniref:hypothetical protein n=1 Tax=Nocardia otitidiscaviarum TaxID=1823 RepID=UPI001894FD64|nr:hypothetical protein [Nocardia otitidiscaviarum]MBF6240358.1 hypothetical protein [Nocardia otitidiscaviarum]